MNQYIEIMRFLHGRLKVNKGGKIRVTVSQPTRVLIMNETQFRRYKNNMTFSYFGGQKEGTFEWNVPSTAIWNVVVEKGAYHKPVDIKASIKVERGVPKTHSIPKSLASTFAEADARFEEHHPADEGQEAAEQ